ncbi:MAG: DciA family protein [Tabrizicola sp.]|uniref:DUF721 domain-containing protein n=1 Tax=Tabrizicola sp. TaxID=2005166 RepID=UPI002ABAC373|nr:DciA family protein [Tabrizicola sp.]MDZ4086554.1 DciA family protein [Tabrizicola sp.]
MSRKPPASPSADHRMRGFEPAFGLMKDAVRTAGESRGFAVARLLTHWAEVAGEDMARKTRPVKIGYGKGGMGATLTLLVKATEAPMVQMALPVLKERVNSVYGYAAISHIHLTQTAATGFAEGQAEFTPAPKAAKVPDPATQAKAQAVAEGVADPSLRSALEQLAQNILTRPRS